MLNCIAIDDEPLALDIITDYASRIPFLKLLRTFDNAIECIDFLKNNQIHLIFLDIEMEGLTGIQLVHALKVKPEVIFITAYDSYAVEGFELEVADYLLKPVSFERFVKSVDRVYNRISSREKSASLATDSLQVHKTGRYIFVKTENRLQKIAIDDILYIEGQGDYLRIIARTMKIMTLQNFRKLEAVLPQGNFVRVHKSYMVALDKIDNVTRNRIKIGE
ncbi:MAG: response regulator transcription factor, partial [Bacteroidetes bacterium]|nr:response regulator transcription factor [Bacteroidota bacterium]